MFDRFLKLAAISAFIFSIARTLHASDPVQQQDAFWVHYKAPSTAASTACLIVDLSDTSNWPHKTSGASLLTGWHIEVDQVAAGTSTVKLGVVTAVNESTGTVTWFYTKGLTLNVSGTTKLDPFVLSPGEINTRVTSNATPYILGGENTVAASSDAALFQTDIALPSPKGGVNPFPAIGDIVAEIVGGGTNAAVVTFDLLYLTAP